MSLNDYELREEINHQNNLLSNRLNYFLISTAFLVTAFSTIVISTAFGNNLTIKILALLVSLLAFGLSLFFTYLIYWDQLLIQHKNLIRFDSEKMKGYDSMKPFLDDAVKNARKGFNIFRDFRHFVTKPLSGELHIPYAWFVPFCLSVFWWLAILFIFIIPLFHHLLLAIILSLLWLGIPIALYFIVQTVAK